MTTLLYLLVFAASVDVGSLVTAETTRVSLTLERANVEVMAGPTFALTATVVDEAPLKPGAVPTDQAPLLLRASGGQIIVEQARAADTLSVSATVPADWTIAVRVNHSGNVSVADRGGDTYVRSAQGSVSAAGQRGAFSLTTMAGELRVSLQDDVIPGDSAATAWNGDLVVDLPGRPGFNIEAQAQAGAVFAPEAWRLAADPNRPGQGWVRSERIENAPTLTLRNISDDVVLSESGGSKDGIDESP